MDMGDERQGLRLPGVRTDNPDGSFDVEYDIPLALYDCRLDDGVTTHQDIHDTQGEFPAAGNPRTHPESCLAAGIHRTSMTAPHGPAARRRAAFRC